jgi:hypothetical protein
VQVKGKMLDRECQGITWKCNDKGLQNMLHENDNFSGKNGTYLEVHWSMKTRLNNISINPLIISHTFRFMTSLTQSTY